MNPLLQFYASHQARLPNYQSSTTPKHTNDGQWSTMTKYTSKETYEYPSIDPDLGWSFNQAQKTNTAPFGAYTLQKPNFHHEI